jgi:hypothetical protein
VNCVHDQAEVERCLDAPNRTHAGRLVADITGAKIANLDRTRPTERAKLLEELKTVLSAHLEARLAVVG